MYLREIRGIAIAVMVVGFLTLSTRAQGSRPPETVLKDFYKWYITAIDKGSDPFTKGKRKLKSYVTLRFIKQIERDEDNGLDADELTQTQEFDKDWADDVNVSKLAVKGTSATAIVTFGDSAYPRMAVTLVKQAGVWKIDRVKDASK
jgi:Protein of unknown function (DUF3828)